jgi:hypothetical protein
VTDNENDSDTFVDGLTHCGDCDVLTDALRDLEQQCREVEDGRALNGIRLRKDFDVSFQEEQDYLARLKKLEHRRDCALEVLLKHQRLEHL